MGGGPRGGGCKRSGRRKPFDRVLDGILQTSLASSEDLSEATDKLRRMLLEIISHGSNSTPVGRLNQQNPDIILVAGTKGVELHQDETTKGDDRDVVFKAELVGKPRIPLRDAHDVGFTDPDEILEFISVDQEGGRHRKRLLSNHEIHIFRRAWISMNAYSKATYQNMRDVQPDEEPRDVRGPPQDGRGDHFLKSVYPAHIPSPTNAIEPLA